MAQYQVGSREKCPYCGVSVMLTGSSGLNSEVLFSASKLLSGGLSKGETAYRVAASLCPNCGQVVIGLSVGRVSPLPMSLALDAECEHLIWPRSAARQVAAEVPERIAQDYREAAEVLSISPKASATLSRRCLQRVLVEAGNVKKRNLSEQIDEVLPALLAYIAEQIDAVRNIGNFAAHPSKNQQTGTIADVEPGEAEWNLDVLELLFDFYYVQPAVAMAKRHALDANQEPKGTCSVERNVNAYAVLLSIGLWALNQAKKAPEFSFYPTFVAMLQAPLTIEAYLNRLGAEVVQDWGTAERLPPHEKLEAITKAKNIKVDKSRRPFQSFRDMFSFRNDVVHAKQIHVEASVELRLDVAETPPGLEARWERLMNVPRAEQWLDDAMRMIDFLNEAALGCEADWHTEDTFFIG